MENKIDLLTEKERLELVVLTKKGQERVEFTPLLNYIRSLEKRIKQLESKNMVYGK